MRDTRIIRAPGGDVVPHEDETGEEDYKAKKLDSIARQREACGSADGADEGEAGEGVRAKTVRVRVSVEVRRNLVSGCVRVWCTSAGKDERNLSR